MIRRSGLLAGTCLVVAGCNHYQSALGGDAADSANFLGLFWIFLAVCAAMYVLIVAAFLIALVRGRRSQNPLIVDNGKHHESDRFLSPLMVGWAALVLVGLSALTVASFLVDRSNAANAANPQLIVNVTANQWWWDVKYSTSGATTTVRTANELHLPVGVPAEVTLQSNDVIHSLWIPNLAGKQDLIPGRVTDIQLWPRKVGLFRGQCAEFCGVQHAHMAIDVTVESKADFKRWLAAQQAPAAQPANGIELAGYRYVTTSGCASCHNISGTPAGGGVAPDLTHFASRRSIAAGALPMSQANIRAWIDDPQRFKPGSQMPKMGLSPTEVKAVGAYLDRLK
jgi:cytochrome c oxidase subunit 2